MAFVAALEPKKTSMFSCLKGIVVLDGVSHDHLRAETEPGQSHVIIHQKLPPFQDQLCGT